MFVASGLSFDVDRYLASSPFKAMTVFRKGDVPTDDNPQKQQRPDSGFTILLSDDGQPGLSDQIEAALDFLIEHENELDRLKIFGVDNLLLDFAVERKAELQRSEYLPPELIIALGRFRMGLVFSAIQLPRG
jgi:hypothetical protein